MRVFGGPSFAGVGGRLLPLARLPWGQRQAGECRQVTETEWLTYLRQAVWETLGERFRNLLPWDQNTGNAFALDLTVRLAPRATNPVLYGRPRPGSKKHVEGWGIRYVPGEMFVDFVAGDLRTPVDLHMLIGCESEMHPDHGTGASPDANNGYALDFRQLLRFPAPVLLFAARVREKWLSRLENSLISLAERLRDDWSAKRLLVVLLPAGYTQRGLVRLGLGKPGESLRFEPLDVPATTGSR